VDIFRVARTKMQSQLHCVGINPQFKIFLHFWWNSQLKEYLTDKYKILENKRMFYSVTVLWVMCIEYTCTELWSRLVCDI